MRAKLNQERWKTEKEKSTCATTNPRLALGGPSGKAPRAVLTKLRQTLPVSLQTQAMWGIRVADVLLGAGLWEAGGGEIKVCVLKSFPIPTLKKPPSPVSADSDHQGDR